MKDKRVIVTGGYGFLGGNLARHLLNSDVDVILAVRSEPEHRRELELGSLRANIRHTMIDDEAVLDELVKGKDYLFHFAWQTDLKESMKNPLRDLRQDVGGLVNILETVRRVNPNLKIVFPSTVTVDMGSGGFPPSVYDSNKLAAENLLQVYEGVYGIRSTCLRLSNVFGEGQRIDNPNRGVLNYFIGRALNGEDLIIYGDGENQRDYSYVDDYVRAFCLAAEQDSADGRIYEIGSGVGKTFNEVAESIKGFAKKIYGKSIGIRYEEYPKGTNVINKRNFVADYSEFSRDTGWKPEVSFEEGLEKTMRFYKDIKLV